ncbi:MAG: acyl-CoA thioesterase, partial [Alistipes sp.]|nr:acyl-CoA thioesterase [Alistipes sp.]
MITHEMKIRVWYKETDQMGFVHHSNYICYYEAARSSFMRWLGVSYAEMEARGVMMPILDVHSKYMWPAFFEEELTVRLTVKELPMARFTGYYEVFNEAGRLINTGSTTLGFIRSDNHRPCRAPQWFVDLLREHWTDGPE